jgi:hypothetical protein
MEEATRNMNEDLENIYKWLCHNKLSLNIDKTKAMIITLKKNVNKNQLVHINNIPIEYVKEYKYLGIVIDEDPNWSAYVEFLVAKMMTKLHLMKNIAGKLNKDSLELLYKSIVGPHFDYCSTILFMLNIQQTQTLQKMQNRFLRLILRLSFDTPINSMLNKLGGLSVKQRNIFNTLRFLYRIENENMPQYLKRRLIKRETTTSYELPTKPTGLCIARFQEADHTEMFVL